MSVGPVTVGVLVRDGSLKYFSIGDGLATAGEGSGDGLAMDSSSSCGTNNGEISSRPVAMVGDGRIVGADRSPLSSAISGFSNISVEKVSRSSSVISQNQSMHG